MELYIAVSGRSAKRKRLEELLRDTIKHESRVIRKPKIGVERRIAYENAPVSPDLANLGKPPLDEGSADATALPIGLDRDWANPVPADGTIRNRYWRERDMPDDAASTFRDKRDRKCMICSQRANDELLSLMAVRVREKGPPSDLLD